MLSHGEFVSVVAQELLVSPLPVEQRACQKVCLMGGCQVYTTQSCLCGPAW